MAYWRGKQPRDDWEISAVQDRFIRATGGWGAVQSSIFGWWEPFTPAVEVPVVISEVPQTWEELEALEPELFEPILETRPGEVPDPYPFDPDVEPDREFVDTDTVIGAPDDWWPTATQEESEEDDMAHDWGHLIREGIGSFFPGDSGGAAGVWDPSTPITPTPLQPGVSNGATPSGGDCDGMRWSGGTPPKGYKVVNSCGVGVLRKVRRRRRRRLLTASDSRDIATIVGLVGKGQMASALINRR